ncbi:methyltransferase domain-containing protein [Ktedonosporobacter rubrisoli]|uniref:Methyltransferase domain-containing protein n=1 Tax=Ktedonosporobacter rubrisoli TaxID=2509675 RepID=A0A4P6JSC9_KTERU|nr:methyltransferase domain-containing protein [Ktedonosporobacter rubrisoli]QBD78294.1 methyltransferase domain-containing protein [Ktedonosporobacter rubrisoli]
MSQLFYVMTIPGLETLAFNEIRTRISEAELVKFARGIALFKASASPGNLLELHTVEDVFFSLAHIRGLGHGRDALRVLHSATLNADILQGLALWRRTSGGRPAKTWRVVSQKAGTHDFRRIDAGQAVVAALQKAMPRGMRLVKDDADVEIWLWLSGSEALIGLRLSDATMRHRRYKQEHLPASLRPTIGAAMSWLAHPTPQDIVLDPLCGAGTIIIERALLAPFAQAMGGDIRTEAVAMARRNARAAKVAASWNVWDARSLPLEEASVTRIMTNLPFGKQIGSHETNVELYTLLAREFRRVLTPDGLLVALTSEDRLLNMILQDAGWRINKKVVLVVLGLPASIFVAEPA